MTKSESFKLRAALLAAMAAAFTVALVIGAHSAHAAFPGSNNAIAFTSTREGSGRLAIYRMGSDGFEPARLTGDGQTFDAYLPAYSPDGSKYAFTVSDSTSESELVVSAPATAIGGNVVAFGPSIHTEAAWYPSGRKLAYRDDATGGGDIYSQALNADATPSGSAVRLTKRASFDGQPAVSPDGKRLAFVSDRDGDREIYLINANKPESATNKAVKLTNNAVDDEFPDWSPSGKKIVFQRGGFEAGQIYVMNSDGTRQTNLTKNGVANRDPAFSPDGKKVAYESTFDGHRDIWRMKADGTGKVTLTDDTAIDANPSWQPIP